MRILKIILMTVLALVGAFVLSILAICIAMAVGIIKPEQPKNAIPVVEVPREPEKPKPVAAAVAPPKPPSVPLQSAAPTPPTPRDSCILRADGDAPVPVFATDDELDEWTSAKVRGNEKAAMAILMSSGAHIIEPGTECFRISGFIVKKVRVLDGPSAGFVGYVPTEWTIPK